MAKLNRREQTIMNYMQNGGNIKKAMIDAGYSETYADRNSKYLLGMRLKKHRVTSEMTI